MNAPNKPGFVSPASTKPNPPGPPVISPAGANPPAPPLVSPYGANTPPMVSPFGPNAPSPAVSPYGLMLRPWSRRSGPTLRPWSRRSGPTLRPWSRLMGQRSVHGLALWAQRSGYGLAIRPKRSSSGRVALRPEHSAMVSPYSTQPNAKAAPLGGGLNAPPAGAPLPGAGFPGTGMPGAGMPGAGFPGAGFPGAGYPGAGYPRLPAGPHTGGMPTSPGHHPSAGAAPGAIPFEESYIENILRLNRGKVATVYMTFENNSQWNAKIFKGVVEAAGRDHIVISDPHTGMRYLLLMVNLDYITFDQELKYAYPMRDSSSE